MQSENENCRNTKGDRIEEDTIILHDDFGSGPKLLKKVKIIRSGKNHNYAIRRTKRGGYLFN